MYTHPTQQPRTNVAGARAALTALRSERLEAAESGLVANALYVDCLEAEIAFAEQAYVALVVAEIARLRADLDGALVG